MLKEIKLKDIKKLLPKRENTSHKGQNGRVLIIGGSIEYHGAPILAGMGALSAGADLVYMYVPDCNFEVTRNASPDFIVKKYPGDYLNERYTQRIIEFVKTCDSILIGPGLSDRESTVNAVLDIITHVKIPTVLDSSAIFVLKKIDKFPLPQHIIITPHENEFKHLVDREVHIDADDPKSAILIRSISMDLNINIILKGDVDHIASQEGEMELNHTGNSGMTVGGTGDVLAGVTAALLATGIEPYYAAKCAAFYTGKAGDLLKKQLGNGFTASDLAKMVAVALK